MNELNYRLGCVLDVTTSTSNWLWLRYSHSLLQYLLLKDQLRAFSVFISWRQSTNFQTKDSVTVRVDAIVLFQVDWRNHWIHENLRSQTCWLHSYTIEIFKTFKSEKSGMKVFNPLAAVCNNKNFKHSTLTLARTMLRSPFHGISFTSSDCLKNIVILWCHLTIGLSWEQTAWLKCSLRGDSFGQRQKVLN